MSELEEHVQSSQTRPSVREIRERLIKNFLTALTPAFIAIFVLTGDVFGLDTATDEVSFRLLQKLWSPFYAIKVDDESPSPEAIRDSIAVVIIEDDDLPLQPNGNVAWPPTFDEYTTLLKQITGEQPAENTDAERQIKGPALVFVDLLFDSPHNNDDICQFHEYLINHKYDSRIPIIIADVPDYIDDLGGSDRSLPGRQGRPLIFERNDCAQDSLPETAMVGWSGFRSDYPLALVVEDDKEGPVLKLTAASKLYLEYLRYRGTRYADQRERFEDYLICENLGRNACTIEEPASWTRDRPPVMILSWGSSTTPEQLRVRRMDGSRVCRDIGDTFIERLGTMFDFLWLGLSFGEQSRARFDQLQPCLYHTQIKASDLLSPNRKISQQARQKLSDRVVLVGARIHGIDDTEVSPVHGRIPGVHVHAMALDNLMNFGTAHLRPPSDLVPKAFLPADWQFSFDDLFQAILIIFSSLLAVYIFETEKPSPSISRLFALFGRRMLFLLIIIAVLILTTFITYQSYHWISFNWASILSFAVLLSFSNLNDILSSFVDAISRNYEIAYKGVIVFLGVVYLILVLIPLLYMQTLSAILLSFALIALIAGSYLGSRRRAETESSNKDEPRSNFDEETAP